MNATRRKEIAKAMALVYEAQAILQTCADDEQEYYDNMPESLQGSEKGENAEADAGQLTEWADALQEIADAESNLDH